MTMTTPEAAARCITDTTFAQLVLEGDEFPEVRAAILADLEAAGDTHGFLNPQPLPPKESYSAAFSINPWAQWATLSHTNLLRLAVYR